MNYLIAHMIEKPAVGDVLPRLPLHMTVVHWFISEATAAELSAVCKSIANTTDSFDAQVAGEDLFGANFDVPVTRVVKSPEIATLHQSLLAALGELGVEHTSTQWMADGYNPHVTHKKDHRLHEGDTFLVDSIDLIGAKEFDGDRTMLERFELERD